MVLGRCRLFSEELCVHQCQGYGEGQQHVEVWHLPSGRNEMLNEYTCHYACSEGEVRVRWADIFQNYWCHANCEAFREEPR